MTDDKDIQHCDECGEEAEELLPCDDCGLNLCTTCVGAHECEEEL